MEKSTQNSKQTISMQFLDDLASKKKITEQIGLVILNQPIAMNYIELLFKASKTVFIADGGSNRLFDLCQQKKKTAEYIPNYILGDFDSIRTDVKQYYNQQNVKIILNSNQDNTDTEKILDFIIDEKLNYDTIIMLGAIGGRFDHTLANISNMMKYQKKFSQNEILKKTKLIILDNSSICCCIQPGITDYIRSQQFEKIQGVGLFTMNGPTQKIKTEGLRWNISDQLPPIDFGSFISSSNEFLDSKVTIETDQSLIFMTTIVNSSN